MKNNKQVPLMLSVPKIVRDKLRTMAAERTLDNPDKLTTASSLAREIILKHLNKIESEEDIVK
jgi:hypothetical protein